MDFEFQIQGLGFRPSGSGPNIDTMAAICVIFRG